MSFPNDFVWGAATAAYQIEGAAAEDGRGPSVWDAFCAKPGAVFQGHSGKTACDHYHRSAEDVDLMASLGLKGYRFSVSWSRVLPEGVGEVNEAGLAFYDRLVDQLLEKGVTPYLTLFHWDFPLALYNRGGWLNRASADWFADYTAIIADRLGDRVKHWMTLNEPQCFINIGHAEGRHAPGLKLALPDILRISHHALLAHGRAVRVLRERVPEARVGIAPITHVEFPVDDAPANVDAGRAMTMRCDSSGTWCNTWFLDPVLKGHYPEDGLEAFGDAMLKVSGDDLDVISTPIDFVGLNIYSGKPVEAAPAGSPLPGREVKRPEGYPMTAFHWPIEPDAMYWGVRFISERYGTPIYITENGLSNIDFVSPDGGVHDPQRVAFTTLYLRALRRAIADGADVRGYFHWSLLDNFEWAEGYKERFGLVHVDFETKVRTPKDSAAWYRGVIASNGSEL